MTIQKSIYRLIKHYRLGFLEKMLSKNCKTVLDIGCQDFTFYRKIKNSCDVTLADFKPKHPGIRKENIENLSFKDNSFDCVIALEVLEHTKNPVKAMQELRRVAKKQIIISVPNEPFFTLFRFFIWEKEHYWAITPKAIKTYLGKPGTEKKIFFKRYYMASFDAE